MTWTRLSDDFYDAEVITNLGHEAFRLHVYALVWCNKQLTDGKISQARARRLMPDTDTAAAIAELVAAGLWTAVDDGFAVDWSTQETRERVTDRRSDRAHAQRRYEERKRLHAAGDHSQCLPGKCPALARGRSAAGAPGDESPDASVIASLTAPDPARPPQGQGRGRGTHALAACGHRLVDDRHCEKGCRMEAAS